MADNYYFNVIPDQRRVRVERRPGTEPNVAIDTAVGDYVFLTGETGAQAQLRVFHAMAEGVRHVRNQRTDMLEGPVNSKVFNHPDVMRVRNMTGPNMVPVRIEPKFSTMIPLGIPFDPVEKFFPFVDEWAWRRNFFNWDGCICEGICSEDCTRAREAFESPNNPHYWGKKAFVSGQNLAGLEVAMKNIFKNRRNPLVPPRDVAAAFIQIFSEVDQTLLLAPSFDSDSVDSVRSHDESKSSGFMNYKPSEQVKGKDADGNMTVLVQRLTNYATQADYFGLARRDLVDLAKEVSQHVRKGVYSRDWFPVCLAKIALKPEIRDPTVSRTKVRVFFIMSYLKLMVDKLLYADIFPKFYGKGMFGIGHVWAHGGAESIARDLGAYDELMGFFETDFSNLDQTLLPGMLTLMFTLPMMFFDPTSSYYDLACAFMTWSADDIAATLVKWIGDDCRLIIGVMFSGLFGTSWGDTLYVSIAVRCFYFFLARKLKIEAPDLFKMFNECKRAGRIYGDNTLLSLPKPVLEFATKAFKSDDGQEWPFGHLHWYFATQWGLNIKLTETFVHLGPQAFWTKVKTTYAGDSPCTTEVVRRGPQYLKRFFVKTTFNGSSFAMPFRETKDYFVKSLITAKEVKDPRVWLSRWIGLLIDTAGTNPTAWSYLSHLINSYLDHECGLGDTDDWVRWLNSTTHINDLELASRLRKMGLSNDGEVTCPTRNELFNKFVPPEFKDISVDHY